MPVPDPLDTLRVLAGRLGRSPSYLELLQELGSAPAGLPVAGVQDPGYPAHPGLCSALLGPVESDLGLSSLLMEQEMRDAHPEFARLREAIVQQLLFGLEPLGGVPPTQPGPNHLPKAQRLGPGIMGNPREDLP